MRFRLQTAVWLLMACVALVAQVVPQARGGDCGGVCCEAEDSACCDACPAGPAAAPCNCVLDAGKKEPLSVPGGRAPEPDLLGRVVVADSTILEGLTAFGVSREYVAASLAVPIRPVRILYGVWRN